MDKLVHKDASSHKDAIAIQSGQTFRVLGLDIEFPFDPYGIQKAMMGQIIRSFKNNQHSLIESPTGTGKTLILLCTSLAWQRKCMSNGCLFITSDVRQDYPLPENLKKQQLPCFNTLPSHLHRFHNFDPNSCPDSGSKRRKIEHEKSNQFNDLNNNISKQLEDEFDEQRRLVSENPCSSKCSPDSVSSWNEPNQNHSALEPCALEQEEVSADIFALPRIYYGTRTHRQISQVIKELNMTIYSRKLKVCILASRERTCINNLARNSSEINETCRELTGDTSFKWWSSRTVNRLAAQPLCQFYREIQLMNSEFKLINDEYESRVWDLEEGIEFGRKRSLCPYYGLRSLQSDAHLTLCPYNYILNPSIRDKLQIKLQNAIVILDEAHNIEDVCRDCASFVIDTLQLNALLKMTITATMSVKQDSKLAEAFQSFRGIFVSINKYLLSLNFSKPPYNDGHIEKVAEILVEEAEMIDLLESFGLGHNNLNKLRSNLVTIKGDGYADSAYSVGVNESVRNENKNNFSFEQVQLVSQLIASVGFVYSGPDGCRKDDYRLVLSAYINCSTRNTVGKPQVGLSKFGFQTSDRLVRKLSLLCMNPAIVFGDVHRSAWSVVVSSGTLAPLESYKTELDCNFSNVFEGAHVIERGRLFATVRK